MSELNEKIQKAINEKNYDEARSLLPDALQDADADTYYLASLVAFDDAQKLEFIEKALKLNPFHKDAYQTKKSLEATDDTQSKEITPAQKKTVEKKAEPVKPVIQAKPEQIMTAQDAINLRMNFNRLGYTHPSSKIAKRPNDLLKELNLNPINPASEGVILHIGIGKPLTDGIMCKHIEVTGYKPWDLKTGELLITNKRLIALKPKGLFTGNAEGYDISILDFKQFEPRETKGAFTGGSLSEIILHGSSRTVTLDMSFVSQKAQAMAALNMFNAVMGASSSNSRTWLDYTKKKQTENSGQQFVNALANQSHTIKEAFYQLMGYICQFG